MWYNKIVENIANIPAAIDHYDQQLREASGEVKLAGNLERAASGLPGLMTYRFNQLQEVEAILEYINIMLRKERSKAIRKFMETYNRELTVREAEKWIDAEKEIVTIYELVNDISLVRNRYLGIMKGLEAKGFQLNNIIRLRIAGLEDSST